MKDPVKAFTGLSLAGLFALFALHGTAFVAALAGAWDFLLAISDKAPLGVAAFFAALCLSTLLWLALRRWIPRWRNEHAWASVIDVGAAAVGTHIAWLQQRELRGLLWGLMAGLCAPYLGRILMALASWVGVVWRNRLAALDPPAGSD